MGFMTEISILNDGWDRLKDSILEDPERFVSKIQELMNGDEHPGDLDDLMRLGNGSTVYRSHHADVPVLYLAWRNSFLDLSKWSLEREFRGRLDNPRDHLIEVLEKDVKMAQQILTETRKFLKAKRDAQKVTSDAA